MDSRGFAILGVAVAVLFAFAIGFGATVMLHRSNLIHSSKRTLGRLALKSHESLSLAVERNSDNTVVVVQNVGSSPSVLKKLLVERPDNSLEVLVSKPGMVGILDNSTFVVNSSVDDSAKIGVLTGLGNVFWEGGVTW